MADNLYLKTFLSYARRLLKFLRLTDVDGLLSITNIACIIVLYKIASSKEPSIIDMGTLLITLSLYYGKSHIKKDNVKATDESRQALDEVKTKVQAVVDKTNSLAAHISLRNPMVK